MEYIDIIKNSPKGGEVKMWDSIERVNELLKKIPQDIAKEFVNGEYEALNGKHFTEEMAYDTVFRMFHRNKDGELVEGELMSIDVMDEYIGDRDKWDVYVGLNGFLHDLARTELSNDVICRIAIEFWFNDDDFDDNTKVWWYFSHK